MKRMLSILLVMVLIAISVPVAAEMAVDGYDFVGSFSEGACAREKGWRMGLHRYNRQIGDSL